MTLLVVGSALVAALCVGYYFGRRTGSTPLTWKKRTSRLALGRLAVNLLVLMTARRIRQGVLVRCVFPDVVGTWGPKRIELLGFLRGRASRPTRNVLLSCRPR